MHNLKSIFALLFVTATFLAAAQPQKVNYQAVALTAGGQTVKNQVIKLRLSIVDSSATGTVLYTETHQPTTDGAGQFSVFLGGGTSTLGTFSSISWSNGKDKFLKAEADVTGGTNFVLMGTSQIVSVPYAISAGSLKEGATITGANGNIYSLSIDSLGPIWKCITPVQSAFAGFDTTLNFTNTCNLNGNQNRINELGKWRIISGNNGVVSNDTLFNSSFSGQAGNTYLLEWSLNNGCKISRDTVQITFNGFFIGQNYQGGIIFYIDNTGQHGLIAATSDQPNSTWASNNYCRQNTLGTSTAIGTGNTNTNRIYNSCGSDGYAAFVCYNLVLNGFSDWFLPSKDELQELFNQRASIPGLVSSNYVSSSENNCCGFWTLLFNNGGWGNYTKSSGGFVRAIRYF
jgi:hypothetical protein